MLRETLAIVVGSFCARLILSWETQYRAHLAARLEIPYARNWRGQYVADLWPKRIERTIYVAIAAVVLSGFAVLGVIYSR